VLVLLFKDLALPDSTGKTTCAFASLSRTWSSARDHGGCSRICTKKEFCPNS
jgi:hypothetical protein